VRLLRATHRNIYVCSRRSAERVLDSISRYVEGKLRLKVNRRKSAVARPWERTFLGYSFSSHKRCRIKVASKSVKRFRAHLKGLFRMGRGRNLSRFIDVDLNPVLRGWMNYFILTETKGFAEELDQWIRRRLRLILWRQWKRPWTRFKKLRQFGVPEKRAALSAFNGRGPWYNSGASHMNVALPKKYFDSLGLFSLLNQLHQRRSVLT
jgi:RNA-directed DNA polymerase